MRKSLTSNQNKSIARGFVVLALLGLIGSFRLHAASTSADEDRYYHIVTIPIPAGITLEAGALQFMPNGQLAASTRLGDIYLIDNVLENPPTHVKFNLFASGLH